jgi:hypothetical protein
MFLPVIKEGKKIFMKNRRLTEIILLLVLSLVLAFSGCSAFKTNSGLFGTIDNSGDSDTTSDSGVSVDVTEGSATPVQNVSITENVKDIDTDSSWDTDVTARIVLNGTSATVDGSGVEATGGTVTVTSAGTFVFSGSLSKGQIVVLAGENDNVRLVLNGVDITAEQNAAIYAKTADKVVVILADGKKNLITDTASYTAIDETSDEPNAAIFADCDLSVAGAGSLAVNANYKHGIATKDDLIVASGDITVNSVEAGLRGKDSITILDGAYILTSGQGDAIKTANDTETDKGWILIKGGVFNINSYHDGISAATAMQIDHGTFTVTAGESANNASDDESFKGIKGGLDIVLNGGVFTVASYDDAIHSNTNITITDGEFNLQTQDDGIHADGTLTVAGGKINIPKCYEGIEGSIIDITNGDITVVSTDDALNAAGGNDGNDATGPTGKDSFGSGSGAINISGGKVKALAASDCIDSNGTLNISGGTVYALSNTTREGDALDIVEAIFTGGTVVYGGLSNTGANPSGASTQSYVYASGAIPDGAEISVKQNGETLASFTSYSELSVFALSSPEIVSGQSYEIYSNGVLIATVTAGSGGSSMGGGNGMGGGRSGNGGHEKRGHRNSESSTTDSAIPGTTVDDESFSESGTAT